MADFRKIYARRKVHPGLIFLATMEAEIFTRDNQGALLNVALDDILAHDLIQEVLKVTLFGEDDAGEIDYELTRHELPKH